jgi:tetratricopeptide (TPR) repeat protein
LVEGLAMAVAWDWGNRTLHQYAAALHAVRRAPEIRSLMGFAGFARQAPSVSYVLAGSFCRYLIDRFGMRSMMAIYGGRSYADLTGTTLEGLILQWRAFLKEIPVTEDDREAVEVFFRTPPVFDRVCARVVARWSWEARRALEAGELGRAAARSWMAYREAGAYGALALHLRALWQGGEDARLVQLADSVVGSSAHPLQFLPLDLMRSDASWAIGERVRAETLVAHLVRVDLSPAMTEAAMLRLMALRDEREPAGLRVLLRGQEADSLRRRLADSLWSAAPASRVAPYLLALLLAREGRREEALGVLLRIRPGVPRFEAARLRHAAELMLALGRYQEARTTFWLSLNDDDTPKSRDRIADWIDRCEWMMHHDG